MTVTEPLANPTAIWVRSSVAANAEICYLLAFRILRGSKVSYWKLAPAVVDGDGAEARRHVGLLNELVKRPDLEHRLAGEILLHFVSRFASRRLLFGHLRTATVSSMLVPSTWRNCVMLPVSWAWNLLTTFQLLPMMLTVPSLQPKKRLSEPAQMPDTSLCSNSCLLSPSGRLTCKASKKSNDFH